MFYFLCADETPFVVVPSKIDFPEIEAGRAIQRLLTVENLSRHDYSWSLTEVAPAYVKVRHSSTNLFGLIDNLISYWIFMLAAEKIKRT
jgi:hypothetical protein